MPAIQSLDVGIAMGTAGIWAFFIWTCENKNSEDMRICWRLVVSITTNGTWGLNQTRIWMAVKMVTKTLRDATIVSVSHTGNLNREVGLCFEAP